MTNLNSIGRNLSTANPTKANPSIPLLPPLSEKTGALACTLQNDYLFKTVMQTDESALRSFLCSLLHLKPEDISSVSIQNPIDIGTHLTDKAIILDVKLLLNNSRIVNLEMQRFHKGDWPERSLFYLCRTFDNLPAGESYANVLPTHHISILDFPLPHLPDEFFANYYIMNSKTYEIYSDKLCLSVLNLSHIRLATDEDKLFRLDQWAALFKAETWEEIKMLTAKNPDFETIAKVLQFIEENRSLVEAYQNYQAEEAYRKHREKLIQEQELTLREQELALQEQELALQKQELTLQEQGLTLREQKLALQEQESAISDRDARIAELEQALAKRKPLFVSKFAKLFHKR